MPSNETQELEVTTEEQVQEKPNKRAAKAAARVAKTVASDGVTANKQQAEGAKEAKKLLDQEPKIMFIIPRAIGEPEGATHEVMINGHVMRIKKGVAVELPASVAHLLANHYNIVLNAGSDISLARDQDGLSEALS